MYSLFLILQDLYPSLLNEITEHGCYGQDGFLIVSTKV